MGLVVCACTGNNTEGASSAAEANAVDAGAAVDAGIDDTGAGIDDTGSGEDVAGKDAADAGSDEDSGAANDSSGTGADTGEQDTGELDTGGQDTGEPDTGGQDTAEPDAGAELCQVHTDCPQPEGTCSKAVCDLETGTCGVAHLADKTPCIASSLCVSSGACSKGICVATGLKNCNDGNICTDDDCDDKTGKCVSKASFKAAGFACQDGNKCTLAAKCFGGTCTAKSQKTCDDDNVCTAQKCDPGTGECVTLPGAATAHCDDGNPCTAADSCDKDGNCVSGKNTCGCKTSADCQKFDDADLCNGQFYCDATTGKCKTNLASVVTCVDDGKNPCALNACAPKLGKCVLQPAKSGVPCDDGNPCTVDDVCDGAKSCKSGSVVCKCASTKECVAQNDNNPCNGTLYCKKSTGECEVNPATVVKCPDFANTQCAELKCDPKDGQCHMTEKAYKTGCDDNDVCTDGDHCLAGKCKSGVDICSCQKDSDCGSQEDGNQCNGTLYCNKATGQCDLNKATIVTCPTAQDTYCSKNRCEAKTGKCAMLDFNEGKPCDDDDVCTPNETCKVGKCVSQTNTCVCANDKDCAGQDDGDVCNGTMFCDLKALDPGTGKSKPACRVNPATIVTCQSVDDSVCSANICNKKTGACKMTARNTGFACDADGSSCTPNDVCLAGKCVADKNHCRQEVRAQPGDGALLQPAGRPRMR